jgi:peptidoglycan hydrolase-like protein with peptidoglycan-binding domain
MTRGFQTELNDSGANIKVDGIQGRETTGAIKEVETLLGMNADGIMDAKLAAALADPEVRAAIKTARAAGATGGQNAAGDPPAQTTQGNGQAAGQNNVTTR